MKEHSWGLFPWIVLVFALVVPNPFELSLGPVPPDDASTLATCPGSWMAGDVYGP